MNRWYRVIGGAVIAVAVVGAIWSRSPGGPRVTQGPGTEVCAECALPPSMAGSGEPVPPIPTGSGRPCLAEFGSDECKACQKMAGVMDAIEPGLRAKLDIQRVDTDDFPKAAQDWRLRMIPTQVLVAADGAELWRHEGAIEAPELLSEIEARAGVGIESAESGARRDG